MVVRGGTAVEVWSVMNQSTLRSSNPSEARIAAYCAGRGRTSIPFERAVLRQAEAAVGVDALLRDLAAAAPPLRLRLAGLVSRRARAELIYWQRLRDYVVWSASVGL